MKKTATKNITASEIVDTDAFNEAIINTIAPEIAHRIAHELAVFTEEEEGFHIDNIEEVEDEIYGYLADEECRLNLVAEYQFTVESYGVDYTRNVFQVLVGEVPTLAPILKWVHGECDLFDAVEEVLTETVHISAVVDAQTELDNAAKSLN